jgi:hypothetical protein
MNKSGSALIFVSLLMTFVGIIIILFTRSSMLYYGFAIERIHYIRSQYALDALAQYGIACCLAPKKNPNERWDGQFEKWPPPDGPYQGDIKISIKNKIYYIDAAIFHNKLLLGRIHCSLHISSEKEAFIDDWIYL